MMGLHTGRERRRKGGREKSHEDEHAPSKDFSWAAWQ